MTATPRGSGNDRPVPATTAFSNFSDRETMARVKIWISPVRGVSDALIVTQANGAEAYYELVRPIGGLEWLGSGYWHPLLGYEGTCYDLPRGFPADNADAAHRLSDPSISNALKALIRPNFPLRLRPQPIVRPRRIA